MNMEHLVATFGRQLEEALQIAQAAELSPLPEGARPLQNIAVFGLGGSAFGGDIVRNYLFDHCPLPFQVFKGYDVPAFVGPHTLAIVSSYSGNTEETLETSRLAAARGARIYAITSGGKLADWAGTAALGTVRLPTGYPPRAAAGFSFVQQLEILRRLGLAPDYTADVREAVGLINGFGEQGKALAHELALACKDRAVVIYSSDAIDSVAIRLRQQINENSKQLCWHHSLPEMNHNELVGWQHPAFIAQASTVLFLRSAFDHPRVGIRFEINREIISKHSDRVLDVPAKGTSKLAQMLYLLHLSDWISLYLAEANGVEAAPVQVIDYLKSSLEARK